MLKITTLLFEKIGLFKRDLGLNRENPRWQDMVSLSAIELELRRRELNEVFKTSRPTGLLKEVYEEDEIMKIVGQLQ